MKILLNYFKVVIDKIYLLIINYSNVIHWVTSSEPITCSAFFIFILKIQLED